MTPLERAGLRRGHYLMETTTAHRGARSYCAKDSEDWPCPTIRLLDALDAAEAQVTALRTALGNLLEVMVDEPVYPTGVRSTIAPKDRSVVYAAEAALNVR